MNPNNLRKDKNLTEQLFEQNVRNSLQKINTLLVEKGKEYRRNNDPYHNFNVGAQLTGQTREEVLRGFMLKHLISVEDLKNDLKEGKRILASQVEEKYNDILVYLLIEKCSLLDKLWDDQGVE
jgi:hypothetical protein